MPTATSARTSGLSGSHCDAAKGAPLGWLDPNEREARRYTLTHRSAGAAGGGAHGLQMGLFAVPVWAPRPVSGDSSAFQSGEFVATCALTAAAWVLADTYRDAPWFSAFRRASPAAG